MADETRGNVAAARFGALALVDGVVGIVVAPTGRLQVAILPTIRDAHIVEIDVITTPHRLQALTLHLVPTTP